MEKVLLAMVGLACLGGSGFVLYKVAPREGRPARAWLEKDGPATAVALGLMMLGTLGIAFLIQAVAG